MITIIMVTNTISPLLRSPIRYADYYIAIKQMITNINVKLIKGQIKIKKNTEIKEDKMNHPATPFSELPMSDSSQFPRQLTVKTVSVCCCNSFCHRYLLCNGKRTVLALQLFESTLDFF